MKYLVFLFLFLFMVIGVILRIEPTTSKQSSLPQIAAELQKEVNDVSEKLLESQAALQEAQRELKDVTNITLGEEEEQGNDNEVELAHLQAIEDSKNKAIKLYATPLKTPLNPFIDRFIQTQKSLLEANERLQRAINDQSLITKLKSVMRKESTIATETVPTQLPSVIGQPTPPSEEAKTTEEITEEVETEEIPTAPTEETEAISEKPEAEEAKIPEEITEEVETEEIPTAPTEETEEISEETEAEEAKAPEETNESAMINVLKSGSEAAKEKDQGSETNASNTIQTILSGK